MIERVYLIILFLGFIFLIFIGLTVLIKPEIDLRDKIKVINFKSVLTKQYSLISMAVEVIGITILIYSFYVPWYYHRLTILIRYFSIIQATNLDILLSIFIFYSFLIILALIFIKIYTNLEIHPFTSLKLMKLILSIPAIIIILDIKFQRCFSMIPEMSCIYSGYSSGFYFYIFGIFVLMTNGIQMSIYSRLKSKASNGLR